MRISIVGVGNVGTQIAVHCTEMKHQVILFTKKKGAINRHLKIVDENNQLIHEGLVALITDNPIEAFDKIDLIFVTVPAFYMDEVASIILPYVHQSMKICLVPGTGGGEWSFRECVKRGAILFGLQRVPSVARLVEYGHIVKATGYREELFIASLPANRADECAQIIGDLFNMKCSSMPNYLNLTLTPSNPILHTTRLRTLFSDYSEGRVYDAVPLFYEEWSNESSELLFKCDEEVQNICNALSQFNLKYVRSLKDHYESYSPEALTTKIRSIRGFKGLTSPTINVDNGYIPDFNSRYFTADFPFGLAILVQIADLLNLAVPNMKETLAWYDNICTNTKRFSFAEYNVKTREDLVSFYSI